MSMSVSAHATMPRPVVMTFAATDPTGGAGVQADLLVYASQACHGLSVVTAVTVQDTVGVAQVYPIDAACVDQQARSVLADFEVAAFKVGVLGSAENVLAVAGILADYPQIPVVCDPVLASGRGDLFASEDMQRLMQTHLWPRVTVLTPNSLEVRQLSGIHADTSKASLALCAQRLIAWGCQSVLLTGTHEETPQVLNTLYSAAGELRSDAWPRLPGSYHGSGCVLSSAVAAAMARGLPISEAVYAAQLLTWQALAHASRLGRGQALPNVLFECRTHAPSS